MRKMVFLGQQQVIWQARTVLAHNSISHVPLKGGELYYSTIHCMEAKVDTGAIASEKVASVSSEDPARDVRVLAGELETFVLFQNMEVEKLIASGVPLESSQLHDGPHLSECVRDQFLELVGPKARGTLECLVSEQAIT